MEEAMLDRIAQVLRDLGVQHDDAAARKVLEAMREPTAEMVDPLNDGMAYFDYHRDDDSASIWRDMIAVALGEPLLRDQKVKE